MRILFVVQRYGEGIYGGAETACRAFATVLARRGHDVEVLTTCATDYVTWRNELPAGVDDVNSVPVRRFRVKHQRDPLKFGRRSQHVFTRTHSVADELRWLDAEGPASPALVQYIRRNTAKYDFWLFFSYRYYLAYHGARAAAATTWLRSSRRRQ